MSTSWQVAGADLDTTTVKVIVEPLTMKADQAVRIQQVARLHALARRHVLGRDLPVYAFRFRFIGPAIDRTTAMNTLRNTLRANQVWNLTAPDAPNQVYFNAGVKTIALSALGIGVVYAEGVTAIALDVVALEPAPEDQTTTVDTGIVGGIAIVFNTGCGAIVEDVRFGFALALQQVGPASDNVVQAAGMVLDQSVPRADSVIPDQSGSYALQQTAPLSEQRNITNS